MLQLQTYPGNISCSLGSQGWSFVPLTPSALEQLSEYVRDSEAAVAPEGEGGVRQACRSPVSTQELPSRKTADSSPCQA